MEPAIGKNTSPFPYDDGPAVDEMPSTDFAVLAILIAFAAFAIGILAAVFIGAIW